MRSSTPFNPDSASARLAEACAGRPILSIVLVSLAAITINCYPVIFCGRSFVGPTAAIAMVPGGYPVLPGTTNAVAPNAHGSDAPATLVWGVPVGFIESRSVFNHGELPLWDRYGHAGAPLIAEAVSMIGDPLQWIVILGHGSSLSWDVKFVAAKFLFCIGFGLLIRRLLSSLLLALLFAALAAYCGAFYYIYNHPAFFVLSYAPWILLSVLELLDLQSENYVRWGLIWLLVNFGCFNAGDVEAAIVLIGGLNSVALAFALWDSRSVRAAARLLTRLAISTALLLALTAPVWVSFLAAMQGAYSVHSEIKVTQFRFATLIGIFDDVFFRLSPRAGGFWGQAPGASFLAFVGSTYALIRWRKLKDELFFWINTAAILLWGGCVFGWVPARVLGLMPLLNRVGHTHIDFSYLLIIHLTIQCAYGFKCIAMESFRQVATGLLGVGLVLAGMTLLFCFGAPHGPVLWIYYAIATAGAFAAPLLFAFLRNRPKIFVPGALGVLFLGFVPQFRFGAYTFDDQVLMVFGPRVVLNAPSPAIEKIKAANPNPFRIAGLDVIIWGDYAAVYGLEDIRSCAPLSNNELVDLLRRFPGMYLMQNGWEIRLENPVLAHALLNLLNVKYILAQPMIGVHDGLGFRLADTGDDPGDVGVVENLEVWPRAFFSDGIVSVSSNDEFMQYLVNHPKQPFIALTPDEISKQPDLLTLQTNANPAVLPATRYVLLPNSTAFDIHASSSGVVCLTEGQAKDFIATANGEPKDILTVNRAFKGIYLNRPGDYHIQFTYRPRYWRLSCALFWIACSILTALCAVDFMKHRHSKRTGQSPAEKRK